MADNFGATPASRVQADSSRFYAVASVDVAANSIYVPNLERPGLFGVAEVPIAAGKLGAFAREGVFAFDFPEGTSEQPAIGTPVYYSPTSAVEGVMSLTPGDIFIGFIVAQPDVSTDKMCVLLAPDSAVAAAAESAGD